MIEPWIGTEYGRAGNCLDGRKLLVVGEVHPLGRDEAEVGAVADVEAHLAGWDEPGLSRITEAVLGRPGADISAGERRGAWSAIAYHVYVPQRAEAIAPLGERAYASGREGLRAAIRRTRPEVAMILGLETWLDAAPAFGLNMDPLKEEYHTHEGVLLARMQRPSRTFAWRVWHGFIRDSLRRALPPDVVPPSIWAQVMKMG